MIDLSIKAELNFTQLKKLGEGGFGSVYLAKDIQLNSIIAVKKIPKSKFHNTDKYFEESKKLYLSNHHNVVAIYYACQDDESIYLSMPYYKNGSLNDLLTNKFLTVNEVIRYSLQFLSGLNNIHTKQLIHFDIKPENIMINDANQALITDFGQAQYVGMFGFAKSYDTTEVLAPPEYFEQVTEHNFKFDIYQAGLTIYRLCNGNKIFIDQLNQAILENGTKSKEKFVKNLQSGNFPNRKLYLNHIPKKLRLFIKKSLHPDPNKRFNSVFEMLNKLSAINDSNDWKYQTNYHNIETWIDSNRNVHCELENDIYHVESKKNGRRVKKYCSENISVFDKDNFLNNCLNSKW